MLCLMLEKKMKFLVEELHAIMTKAKQLRKKKRSTSHKVVTMDIRDKMVKERM